MSKNMLKELYRKGTEAAGLDGVIFYFAEFGGSDGSKGR